MIADQERAIAKRNEDNLRGATDDERIAEFARELALRDEQRKASQANYTEQRERVQREVSIAARRSDSF